ncbi:DDE-type integrase/transposase/recombinase [Candidatus Woesearchaeota archaeon]|nr:DDE-type integrase/transposase/recombinase [Candidatus Woesearchaeota archaeon]
MIQTDLSSFSYKKGSLCAFCKKCGGENFYLDGKNKKGIQKYECRTCGCRFIWTSDLPRRRTFSSIIAFAVEIYTDLRKAISLEGISELLKKIFNVVFSREAIRQWVLSSKKGISRREICVPTTWHADETYVKIKGKGYWLWIVYDKIGVLSWRISKVRRIKDARILLRAAMIVAGVRPKQIITDGLEQYNYAIKKEIGWNYKEQKKRHVVSSGIGRNWFIERLNKEIKRRIKWFSTFQSLKGAEAFFGLWFYHYNQRKLSRIT